jgi:hypothetical protein
MLALRNSSPSTKGTQTVTPEPNNPRRENLTEGWTAGEDNESLANFSESLHDALPELSEATMNRIDSRFQAELDKLDKREATAVAPPTREHTSTPAPTSTARRWFALTAGLAAVAAVLLLGINLFWHAAPQQAAPIPPVATAPPAPVEDHFQVRQLTREDVTVPDRPLIVLDEYESLIEIDHIVPG